MTRVLILEDQKESRKALSEILRGISGDITISEAASYQEAVELLGSSSTYDLFLLDVNLDPKIPEDSSGITFAKEIREKRGYEFTPVVMITSVAALELKAYREIQCYQYILKPFFRQDVERVVRKVLTNQKPVQVPMLLVKKDGINYQIDCRDIIYIKAVPRGVCLYFTKDELAVPYLSIRQLTEQLPEDFIQCHRMFVVNRNYIDYLDIVNQIIMMKGIHEQIDIGVTYKAEIRRRLT